MEKSFENIIVIIFNFFGSWLFAFLFESMDGIIFDILMIFCILNFLCFVTAILPKLYKEKN